VSIYLSLLRSVTRFKSFESIVLAPECLWAFWW